MFSNIIIIEITTNYMLFDGQVFEFDSEFVDPQPQYIVRDYAKADYDSERDRR